MTHDELRDKLGAYLDGELDAAQRSALEAHLESCEGCRGELAALRALDGVLANRPVPDPGEVYWARFADRVTERLGPQPAEEPARLYERLTGWLFPRGHFAWARAAVAVATCTLLVTVGLHGFKTAEVAVRPRPPVAFDRPTVPSSDEDLGVESRVVSPHESPAPEAARESQGELGSPPARAKVRPETEVGASGTESGVGDEPAGGAPAVPSAPAAPAPLVVRDIAAEEYVKDELGSGSRPLRTDTDAPPAPVPPPADRGRKASKPQSSPERTQGDLTKESKEAMQRAQPERPVVPRHPETPGRLEERDGAGSARGTKDDAPSLQKIELVPGSREESAGEKRSDAASQLFRTQGPQKPEGVVTNSGIHIEPPRRGSTVDADSLLAREARLWPQRDDEALRPQLEDLGRELAARADDARVRARAREVLGYLATTSSSATDAERWRSLLRSLPQP